MLGLSPKHCCFLACPIGKKMNYFCLPIVQVVAPPPGVTKRLAVHLPLGWVGGYGTGFLHVFPQQNFASRSVQLWYFYPGRPRVSPEQLVMDPVDRNTTWYFIYIVSWFMSKLSIAIFVSLQIYSIYVNIKYCDQLMQSHKLAWIVCFLKNLLLIWHLCD